MGAILSLLAFALHLVLCFAGAPLLWGGMDKLYARMTGQPGPSIVQPYRYIAKLLNKTALLPDTATDMFALWPLGAFLALSVVVMLIPGFCTGMFSGNASDYVTVIGLLTLGRAAIMLAGLETGSALGSIAIARFALPAVCAEATLFVLLLVFAYLAQSTTLNGIALAFGQKHGSLFVSTGFALGAMLVVAFTEAGYKPFRQQDLLKGQEATELGYSGRLLALLDYAAMLRLLAWMNLIICIFVPFGMAHAEAILSWPGGVLLWLFKLFCLSTGLVIFKVLRGQARLSRVPEILSIALVLSVLSAVLLVVKVGM